MTHQKMPSESEEKYLLKIEITSFLIIK